MSAIGLVDNTGKEIVPCEHSQVWVRPGYVETTGINKGIFNYSEKKKKGIFDLEGNMISPCIYSDVKALNDKYFVVQSGGKYGVVDRTGATVIPFIYDGISDEYNDLFVVKSAGGNGVVDMDNGTVIAPGQYVAPIIREGCIMVGSGDGKSHLVDMSGVRRSEDYRLFGYVDFDGYASFKRMEY